MKIFDWNKSFSGKILGIGNSVFLRSLDLVKA